MPVLLALAAAVSWGTSDFFGGLAARRGRVNAVALGTQAAGLVTFVPVVFIMSGRLTAADFWWSFFGGFGTGYGLFLLYTGFTKSRTGVVAPIAAVATAAVPAIFGLATGESLSFRQAVGGLLALTAIWLVSRRDPGANAQDRSASLGVLYGAGAGLGFAFFFIAIDQLSEGSGAWGVLPTRLGGIVIMLIVAAIGRLPVSPPTLAVPTILLSGLIGSIGNLFFIVATRLGDLAVVAVVAALFPAATVTLAYFFLAERLNRWQRTGVAVALAAVALVSAG